LGHGALFGIVILLAFINNILWNFLNMTAYYRYRPYRLVHSIHGAGFDGIERNTAPLVNGRVPVLDRNKPTYLIDTSLSRSLPQMPMQADPYLRLTRKDRHRRLCDDRIFLQNSLCFRVFF
jgi:hypothetical protein